MQGDQVGFYLSARDTWLRTFQVMAAFREGALAQVKWPRDLFLTTEPGAPGLTLRFPGSPAQKALEEWADNAMVATFAMWAMAAAGALEAAYGRRHDRLNDPDPDRRNLRCIWYMIRCAFAHPSAGVPTWECLGPYRARFALPGSFTIDGVSLHSQPFSIDQLGGWHHVYALLKQTDYAVGISSSRY